MSDPIANWETVKDAALALRARGERISNAMIINELGGGSKETVSSLLRRFRDEFPEAPHEENVPAHLASEAQGLVSRLYGIAKAEARGEFERDRGYQASVTAGLREDLDDSESEVAALKARLGEIQPRLDDALSRNADLVARCSGAEASLIDERVGHAQTKRDLDQARQSIAALKVQLDHAAAVVLEVSSLRTVVAELAKSAKKPAAGRGRKPGRPRKARQGTAELAPSMSE
jgi:chromosome segregation ATPase